MFLNIILTILVVVLITITFLLVRWWRNFGKNLFETMTNMKKITGGMNPNLNMNTQSIGDLSERLKKINEMFGNIKK